MKVIYSLGFAASLALGQQAAQIVPAQEIGPAGVIFFANADESKGAAYSADPTPETTQVLQDGNRIKNTNRSKFARDTEGRTRRESKIQMLGPIGQTEEPVISVFINDPVAKVQYTLDSHAKIALKSKSGGSKNVVFRTQSDQHVRQEIVIERKIVQGDAQEVLVENGIVGPTTDTTPLNVFRAIDTHAGGEVKREDLGRRMVEGLNTKGTRMTMTIPAGEVGNERPIEIVTETWFSEEINAMVLTKHNDPRMGETVTRLENIKLGAPPKSLFEPPADYKVEEVSNMRMPMPAMPTVRVREEP